MIFRNPSFGNDHNITAPTDAQLKRCWDYTGDLNGYVVTAIGPRLFVTAAHLSFTYANIVYRGQSYQIVQYAVSTNVDATYFVVDKDVPEYAPIYNNETLDKHDAQGNCLNKILCIGTGVGRKDKVTNTQAQHIGWTWDTIPVKRWGLNYITLLAKNQIGVGQHFQFLFQEGTGEDVTVTQHDSGGAAFINIADEWLYLGPMSLAAQAGESIWGDASTGTIINCDLPLIRKLSPILTRSEPPPQNNTTVVTAPRPTIPTQSTTTNPITPKKARITLSSGGSSITLDLEVSSNDLNVSIGGNSVAKVVLTS